MMSNSCENCGEEIGVSYPDDPEVMAVLTCSWECADELAPVPTGFAFRVDEEEP